MKVILQKLSKNLVFFILNACRNHGSRARVTAYMQERVLTLPPPTLKRSFFLICLPAISFPAKRRRFYHYALRLSSTKHVDTANLMLHRRASVERREIPVQVYLCRSRPTSFVLLAAWNNLPLPYWE
jgi:hypothetical protein